MRLSTGLLLAAACTGAVFCHFARAAELGITADGRFFTIDGVPTFLNGVSYYGSQTLTTPAFRVQDLDDMVAQGFNWIRVWVHWAIDEDVSVLNRFTGEPIEPYMSRLKTIIQEANLRGMIVDVTESKGNAPWPPTHVEHLLCVQRLATELLPYRNVYFDLANECNFTATPRYVTLPQMAELIAAVKAIDPGRICTASFAKPGGSSGTQAEIVGYITQGHVDFLAPHLCRTTGCSAKPIEAMKQYIAWMKEANVRVPVHMQEPFRRISDTASYPTIDDFYRDATGSKVGEAAGWCFHNGQNNDNPPTYLPLRSFVMSDVFGRLYSQFDAVEQVVAANVTERIAGTSTRLRRYQAEYEEHLQHDTGVRSGDAWTSVPGTHTAGLLTRGPAIDSVPGGSHRAIWQLKVDNISIDNAMVVTLKVTRNAGTVVLASSTIRRQDFQSADAWQEFALDFLSNTSDVLEFRTEWHGLAGVELDWVTLQISTDNAPVIAEVVPSPDEATAGSAYSRQMSLLQGDPSPSWALLQGPGDAQISNNGLITGWTPAATEIGHLVTFVVEAVNPAGSDTVNWQVHIGSVADYDNDDDVDQSDYGFFQKCLSGFGIPLDPGCEPADLQGSGFVDEIDLLIFQGCMRGPDIQAGC